MLQTNLFGDPQESHLVVRRLVFFFSRTAAGYLTDTSMDSCQILGTQSQKKKSFVLAAHLLICSNFDFASLSVHLILMIILYIRWAAAVTSPAVDLCRYVPAGPWAALLPWRFRSLGTGLALRSTIYLLIRWPSHGTAAVAYDRH